MKELPNSFKSLIVTFGPQSLKDELLVVKNCLSHLSGVSVVFQDADTVECLDNADHDAHDGRGLPPHPHLDVEGSLTLIPDDKFKSQKS